MNFGMKGYGEWKRRRPGPGGIVKLLKKAFRSFCTTFTCPDAAPVRRHDGELAFMTCILKVNCERQGWQKSVLSVLKNCKGVQFRMDGEGMVEVNAVGEAEKVLKRIGRSRKVELQWIQFGQCSANLFMPNDPPAAPVPPTHTPHGYPYPPARPFSYLPPF